MQSILTEIKSILSRNLFYCDVGARGGIERPWLSFRSILNLISFESDKEAFDLLLNEEEEDHQYYPYVLHSQNQKLSINLTNE